MRKASKHIPVNTLPDSSCRGIMLMRDSFNGKPDHEEVERAHRDGGFTFIIQEEGITHIEIDFQTYALHAPSIIFINPDQVHRLIAFEHALISTWIITAENLRPEHQQMLESISPANALKIDEEALAMLSQAFALCLSLSERKADKLYHVFLKESCNTLVTLFASQYLARSPQPDKQNRTEAITKEFKTVLEKNFKAIKTPGEYAGIMNISTSYLNECVKAMTGRSVTAHIQQRVMLEAKRLLYHSNKSVKEIAAELGYDDHSYFTRLFAKVTKVSPVVFKSSNRE